MSNKLITIHKHGVHDYRKCRIPFAFSDLGDFAKSTRDPVRVQNYAGIGIECSPTKHGYPSKFASLKLLFNSILCSPG